MQTKQNIIRKQTVNFQYNGNTDAFALQKEVSDWCNFSLIPEIEQQLELSGLGDMYLSIDKLVIHASVNHKEWQQQIRNQLLVNLNQQLKDYKPAFVKEAGAERAETRSQKLDELILFFFENGYLPWWSKAFVQTDFNALLVSWINEEKTQTRRNAITLRLQQIVSAPLIRRMMNQLPDDLFFKWTGSIFKAEAEIISEAESFSRTLLKEAGSKSRKKWVATVFNEVLLAMLIEYAGKIDIEQTMQAFRARLHHESKGKVSVNKAFDIGCAPSENQFTDAWKLMMAEEPGNNAGQEMKVADKDNRYNIEQKTEAFIRNEVSKDSIEQITEGLREGIYIENAGAVITAAFLPRLFDRLEIASKTEIIKSDLAVMLIQYIVSGNAKSEEHELVLPKILCGIDPRQPVNTNRRLTLAQMKEADEMLQALIEHWSVLKGTSVEGLRESFLKRSGKLMQVDDEWLLQAEQKAYDMLLEQLPWSISLIKLPWMRNVLKTEWV